MRIFLINILLCFFIVNSSCKKDDVKNVSNEIIIGSWELDFKTEKTGNTTETFFNDNDVIITFESGGGFMYSRSHLLENCYGCTDNKSYSFMRSPYTLSSNGKYLTLYYFDDVYNQRTFHIMKLDSLYLCFKISENNKIIEYRFKKTKLLGE